jgi:hydroxymethylpyrimidine/phosphomethylpyrimidine kinase
MPSLAWIEDDEQQEYLDAFRELVLPQAELLVGNHQTLTDFLLPEWDADRPASPRELAVAAAEHGTRFVLVTGVNLPNQFIDNVLASGTELHDAVGEALTFLDQALDAGFRPGMGNVLPDRFFWALPPEEQEGEAGEPAAEIESHVRDGEPRRVH